MPLCPPGPKQRRAKSGMTHVPYEKFPDNPKLQFSMRRRTSLLSDVPNEIVYSFGKSLKDFESK